MPVVTDRKRGAIGADLNADHLAICETDASGNYVRAFSVPLVTYGKSTHQAQASSATRWLRWWPMHGIQGNPSSSSGWTSGRRKLPWRVRPPAQRHAVLFGYGRVRACFISRGHRQGVEVYQVNPAFSSVIGRVKFMERYGLSVHQPAALVLARRSSAVPNASPAFGCVPWATGSVSLHRTCKGAAEARVDLLGRCSRAVETGACRAAPAGKAQTPTQFG